MAAKSEFIATGSSAESVEQVRQLIGADTLGYLSIEVLHESVSNDPTGAGFCDACFTGNYPIPVQLQLDKLSLERTLTQPENV